MHWLKQTRLRDFCLFCWCYTNKHLRSHKDCPRRSACASVWAWHCSCFGTGISLLEMCLGWLLHHSTELFWRTEVKAGELYLIISAHAATKVLSAAWRIAAQFVCDASPKRQSTDSDRKKETLPSPFRDSTICGQTPQQRKYKCKAQLAGAYVKLVCSVLALMVVKLTCDAMHIKLKKKATSVEHFILRLCAARMVRGLNCCWNFFQ